MKIVIIGAGPVGCYAGHLLAKKHQVEIYENHPNIGLPIQCTGILTSDFDKFNLSLNDCLVNTITQIEAISPNQQIVKVKQKDYIVCRKKFDNYLGSLAIKSGAKIFLNHVFIRKEGNNLIIRDLLDDKEKEIEADIIIAADGPLSLTAKAFGLFNETRSNYYGIQAIVEGNFENNVTKTYFGNDICPGFFVWVVPESSQRARIGLYTEKNSKQYFDQFMKDHFSEGFKVVETQAGIIPIFNPQQKLKKANCYVIGDASSYVKATTGGGIIPGMKQAQILADCLDNDKDFEQEVKNNGLRKKMLLHLYVSKMMKKFSDNDWDKLFRYFNQDKVKKVLSKYTRDNPLPLLWNVLIREPRFLYFFKYLFKI
ncbi:MAG: NAD(P)/FAD-dependent oxidoreductase [Candidatus Woesearchaeota archaeon]